MPPRKPTSTVTKSKPATEPGKSPGPSVESKMQAPKAPASFVVTHDLIAQRAYLKWMSRGGDPHTNWIEAEAELLAESGAKKR